MFFCWVLYLLPSKKSNGHKIPDIAKYSQVSAPVGLKLSLLPLYSTIRPCLFLMSVGHIVCVSELPKNFMNLIVDIQC